MGAVLASPQYGENWLNLDGSTVNVEDFPLLWINELYYNTFKGNTFDVPVNVGNVIWAGDAIDCAAVTAIDLNNQSLTTDFTSELLNKFLNLTDLRCYDNQIAILAVTNLVNLNFLWCYDNQLTVLDVTNLASLTDLRCYNNQLSVLNVTDLVHLTFLRCDDNSISVLDVTNLTSLERLYCFDNSISVLDATNLTSLTLLYSWNNSISTLDIANLSSLTNLRCFNNQLDNIANSQILIDLDGHGLSNGYFQSSIFGGGSLTAAGTTAKNNLLTKGWTIAGL